ncbi:MAG: NADH-quinone oxidoreductase subunit NuoE, partial [Firmicutes bacterium]|nr:NADH-quinone oxidoreductase subunit NuoE [Bacillota bacterium]
MSCSVCLCDTQLSEEDKAILDEILAQHPLQESSLIPVLQETQARLGYLPRPAMEYLAKALKVPFARVYGVASFYAQFHLQPRGRHIIRVCQGTACHVRGAKEVLNAFEDELGIPAGNTTEDLEYTLEVVACIGACGLAPTIMIDDETYGRLTPRDVRKLLRQK